MRSSTCASWLPKCRLNRNEFLNVQRRFELVFDLEAGRLTFEWLCAAVECAKDTFGGVASVTVVNFDEGALFVDPGLRRKFRDFVDRAPVSLRFASYEFRKALRHSFSSDSLLKEYGGQLWEPVFPLKSFKNSGSSP